MIDIEKKGAVWAGAAKIANALDAPFPRKILGLLVEHKKLKIETLMELTGKNRAAVSVALQTLKSCGLIREEWLNISIKMGAPKKIFYPCVEELGTADRACELLYAVYLTATSKKGGG